MIIKDLKIQPGDKSFTFTEQWYNITDSKQYPNIKELRITDNVTKIGVQANKTWAIFPNAKKIILESPTFIGKSYTFFSNAINVVDTIVLGFTGEISLGNLRLIRRYTRNFEVSKKNPLYCSLNGLVYSKNGSQLLSCPQWKTGIMVIGKGVESICDNAFCMCKISSVKFSDTVTNIGSMSFYNCDRLKNVVFGKSIKEIEDEAFYGCEQLKKLTFPSNLKIIHKRAFSKCWRLSEIHFANGIKIIEAEAFRYTSLPKVMLPASIKYLGIYSFYDINELHINANRFPKGIIESVTKVTLDEGYMFLSNNQQCMFVPKRIKYLAIDMMNRVFLQPVIAQQIIDRMFCYGCGGVKGKARTAIAIYVKFGSIEAREYLTDNSVDILLWFLKKKEINSFINFLNLGITKTNDLRTLLSTVSIEENPVAKAYILQTIKNKKLHNVNDIFII